jgi:hypothetical protein
MSFWILDFGFWIDGGYEKMPPPWRKDAFICDGAIMAAAPLWRPRALAVIQNPKSKIQNPREEIP